MIDLKEYLAQASKNKSKPIDRDEENQRWEQAKSHVDKLTSNYRFLIEEKMKQAPGQLRIKSSANGTYYEYEQSILGYPTYLIHRSYQDGKSKANYAIYNSFQNRCYIRTLDELEIDEMSLL